ncbi:nuclear RNA export factor 2-like [Chelonus insularis]|uniref:nuclear RNA export factor 2-like n=1 Tax=Chelonus insularis TaxID=460826 RepID=UPI001589C321|nr:nuclear RNA export factor 2-like [Chelonus insularis]
MQNNLPLTPIQLDVSTAIRLTKNEGMFKERSLMARNDAWHRIKILRGAKYDKEFVLQAILTAAEPADLIPVRYQPIGLEDTCFIARNCGPALEKLCKNNLIIKIPKSDPLILVITLAFASIQDLKVSIQPLLLASLTKRFNQNNKTLDLNNFHRDGDIANHVYCPLSQTRTFSHVLKLTKTALASFEHLNLQNNQLSSLTALENSNLSNIKSLDLRNNNLIGMEALTPIRELTITELWLDGNPLCENYSSAKQYTESAKKYCPHLKKLDGIELDDPDIPLMIHNFWLNSNAEKLVKQFAEHFFTIYDQRDRAVLKRLYHDTAVYSLTVTKKINKSNYKTPGFYTTESRNLLNISNSIKYSLLHSGPDKILSVFKKLPRCLHDRTTFQYDVAYQNDSVTVFSINGFFKYIHGESQLYSFNRTFVIISLPDNEYKIINDQYHIDINSVKIMLSNFEEKLETFFELSLSYQEKKRMISTLVNITTLNEEWSQKFLEEVNWDLKRAILNFIHIYTTTRVPNEAFS